MADTRGRDLKVSILSDTTKFDLTDAADEIEKVGTNAQEMGEDVDKATDELRRLAAMGQDAQRELDRLNTEVKDNSIEKLGKDAKETSRKVDAAFEDIARSSRSNMRKVDDDIDKAGKGFDEFKDEAKQSGRESAASFSGGFDDVTDLVQETAANAFAGFGPIGAAAGIAAAAGLGTLFTRLEEFKEDVRETVDQLIEEGGRLSSETIDREVQRLAVEGELDGLKELIDTYKIAGVTYKDLARAKAGDLDAIQRVDKALKKETERRKENADELGKSEAAVAAIGSEYDSTRKRMRLAQEAAGDYADATKDSTARAKRYVDDAATAWDDLAATYGEDIIGKIKVDQSQALRDARIAWGNADAYFRRNPITLRVRYAPSGQRPIRDVP